MPGPPCGKLARPGGGGVRAGLGGAEVDAAVDVHDSLAVQNRPGRQLQPGDGEVHPDRGDVPAGTGLQAHGLGIPPQDEAMPVELGFVVETLALGQGRHGLGESDGDGPVHAPSLPPDWMRRAPRWAGRR